MEPIVLEGLAGLCREGGGGGGGVGVEHSSFPVPPPQGTRL